MKPKHLIIIICILIVTAATGFIILSSDETEQIPEALKQSPLAVRPPSDNDESPNGPMLHGQVLDGLNHKALEAVVSIVAPDQTTQTVACDASGSYQFDIRDGKNSISAAFKGYVPRGKNEQSYAIEVNEDDSKDIVQNIELWPESKLIGRIVNDNVGIPAVAKLAYQVDASGAENYDFISVTTDNNGEFAFDMAYAGTVKLIMNAEGYPEQKLYDIELSPGKTVDLGEIPLLHGVSVQGMVLDKKTQRPIPNATLQVIEKEDVIADVTSNDDGFYQLASIVGTRLQLKTMAEGYQDDLANVLLTGNMKQEHDVYLTPIEGISLVINNITGRKPILSTVTITDIPLDKVVYQKELENGTYKLPQLTEGPYLLNAISADGESTAIARVASGNTVTLTLKPYGKISIQFILSDPNAKLTEGKFQYTYDSEDGQNIISDWFLTTDDIVTLAELKPGTYKFDAQVMLSTNPHNWINLSSKPIHLNMGDNELIRLTLANANNDIRCNFPEDKSSPEMAKAEAECMKNANELQQMFISYLEVDYYTDNPSEELQNYLLTATQMLNQFSPAYSDIIQHSKNPEMLSGSMYKMAESFDKIGQFIISSPVPEELPDDVKQQYKGILSEYSNMFYKKASAIYEKLITVEKRNDYISEYSAKAVLRLEELIEIQNP